MLISTKSCHTRTRMRWAATVFATAAALSACAGAPIDPVANTAPDRVDFPVSISSCGHTSTLDAPPTKAVTLNQGATEVMLALGLDDAMVGTAGLDDAIAAPWQEAYRSIPVLAKQYPTHEAILAASPDFIYASYSSAFEDKVAGSQSALTAERIASYLSPFGCKDKGQRPTPSFESAWSELAAVAKAFGVSERADALKKSQATSLAAVRDQAKGTTVLWYDSGTKTPFVGAGGGGPQLILDTVGATNIFADLNGGWADGNWEDVIAADPDVIVLADASWDTAASKKAYLTTDPVLRGLRAVRTNAFVTLPFSETTPGVRLADGATSLARQLAARTATP